MSFDPAALAASLDADETELLGDEMRTTILDHGARTPRVLVLLHGLTASPRTWRAFAEVRHARGDNVLIARLPRHGHQNRMSEALAQLTTAELTRQAARIVDAAVALGDEVTLLGHSMGGALALHSAHRDARIFRAIAVAPFLGIKRLPRDWHAWTRSVLERTPNRFLFWDPLDRGRSTPDHGYDRYTTRSIAAGLGLADALQEDARTGPPRAQHIEIVRNAGETSVNNSAINDLVARWRSAGGEHVRIHRLVGAGLSHDVIEPERPHSPAARFLPLLHALLDAPPSDTDTVLNAHR
jgi:pimeloyl-ACP methyl ester carboxylesterase